MRFLISILFCLSAWAQPEPVWRKLIAVPTATAFTPQSIPGLAYWWDSSTMDTNDAVVTNWIDKIQSSIMTNSGTGRPLNTSTGLFFSGSTFLTNAGITLAGIDVSIFTVMKWTDPNNTISPYIAWNEATAANTRQFCLASKPWADSFNHGSRWGELVGATSKYALLGNSGGTVPTNSWITLCSISAGANAYYTNAVSTTFTAGPGQGEKFNGFGWDGPGNGDFFIGVIRHILVYTNALSVASISNLNKFEVPP